MDMLEGVGESSSPPRDFSTSDIRNDVYNRLLETGNKEAVCSPGFRDQLDAHFDRLPPSYALDVNMERVENVLIHQKLLAMAKHENKRPVFHIHFLENISSNADGNGGQQSSDIYVTPSPSHISNNAAFIPLQSRNRDRDNDFEPCSKLEDLNLDVHNSKNSERGSDMTNFSRRQEVSQIPVHEVIFSAIDKPKLLSQLSAMLSDIGLNIREAHVFSTIDGYSLDVFVVDGWPIKDTVHLYEEMEKIIARSEESLSGSTHSLSNMEKASTSEVKCGILEIDRRLLRIGERIASGSCGDLHVGVYDGQDVAVKVLRSEHLNETLEDEFSHEVAILSEVQHRNVVRFIGACTKSPDLCIITEYMPGGSLYNYLHRNHNILQPSQFLRIAIDVCKGMEYLHENHIIHRDLKTANLLMDADNVVKVADFGVARFQTQGGVMTAETGTYRWMAPEVINHQPYDQKADVFSFGVVLWELITSKIPYDTMTPLQAALGVRQGLRPNVPENAHPKLVNLMQRCWEAVPDDRPSFSQLIADLEELQGLEESLVLGQQVESKPILLL